MKRCPTVSAGASDGGNMTTESKTKEDFRSATESKKAPVKFRA
jgi:hypothetical protein